MPIMMAGMLAKQGFALARKNKVGAKLLGWAKKGFSLTNTGNGMQFKSSGFNANVGGGNATASVGNAVSGMSTTTLIAVAAGAFLLLKK
jgi:hypothetical protein